MKSAMTVLGPVPVEELGFTLTHEHIILREDYEKSVWRVDPSQVPGLPPISVDAPLTLETLGVVRRAPSVLKDNWVLPGEDVMARELMYFKEAGGGCIVEVSPNDERGDVTALKRLSERTGLHLVAATGFYLEPGWPEFAHRASADQLARVMVQEYEDGIGDTGVRPGIIGEIGTSTLTAGEEKMLRAAARASLETGLAVSVHTNADQRHGLRIIDILTEEGMSPDRIIMTHQGANTFEHRAEVLERYPERALAYLEHTRAVLDRGAVVAFDNFGKETYIDNRGFTVVTDTQRIAAMLKLIEADYASQLLISHDIDRKAGLRCYGGWGYGHIQAHIIPRLRAQGVSDYDIRQMTVRTPARLLACID